MALPRPGRTTLRMLLVLFIMLLAITIAVKYADMPEPEDPDGEKSDGWAILHMFEVLGILVFVLTLYHAKVRWGSERVLAFFPALFIYALAFEDINITISDQYGYNPNAWFLFHVTMIAIPLGWCIIVYAVVTALEASPRRLTPVQTGLMAGALALSIDLGIDATAFAYGLWTWKDGYWFGVPLVNFVGWFVVVFLWVSLWTHLRRKELTFRKELVWSFGVTGGALLVQYPLMGFFMAIFFSLGVF